MLPTCFPHSPPHSPTLLLTVVHGAVGGVGEAAETGIASTICKKNSWGKLAQHLPSTIWGVVLSLQTMQQACELAILSLFLLWSLFFLVRTFSKIPTNSPTATWWSSREHPICAGKWDFIVISENFWQVMKTFDFVHALSIECLGWGWSPLRGVDFWSLVSSTES